jgi:hypothetical protein
MARPRGWSRRRGQRASRTGRTPYTVYLPRRREGGGGEWLMPPPRCRAGVRKRPYHKHGPSYNSAHHSPSTSERRGPQTEQAPHRPGGRGRASLSTHSDTLSSKEQSCQGRGVSTTILAGQGRCGVRRDERCGPTRDANASEWRRRQDATLKNAF